MKRPKTIATTALDTVIIDRDGIKATLVGVLTVESKRPLKKIDYDVRVTVEEAR